MLYCTGAAFLTKMQAYIREIELKSEGELSFIEYIILPHFGNAILRFDINKENYTLDNLDAYEAFMQDIVQDEFLVDFMGSVYQTVGFKPRMHDEKFRKCYHSYRDVKITPAHYQAALKHDAASLLEKCGLSPELKVWELQIEEDVAVFVLGERKQKIGTYAFEDGTIHVYEVEEMSCIGLMRAAMYAKMKHISMVRVLLEVT